MAAAPTGSIVLLIETEDRERARARERARESESERGSARESERERASGVVCGAGVCGYGILAGRRGEGKGGGEGAVGMDGRKRH